MWQFYFQELIINKSNISNFDFNQLENVKSIRILSLSQNKKLSFKSNKWKGAKILQEFSASNNKIQRYGPN